VIKRISIFALALLLFPLAASAQNNELGVFASTTQLDDNEIQDSDDVFDLEFDEDMGIGVMYNRFWFGAFSTELGYQRLGADLTASLDDVSQELGELDLDILSATGQLHFARGSLLSPYVGGGLAYISGEAGNIDGDEIETVDLENELEFLVNAGLNVGLGRTFGIFLDGKYIMYEARGEGDSDGETLDLNPLIISAGVKLKF
jgi:opacity protein-like surface antigen